MAQKADPYRSERLIYRAIQPEDLPLIDTIQNDAWAYGNSSFTVMKPQGPHDIEGMKDALAKQALLGVVICLPAPVSESKGEGEGEGEGAAAAKPIPIGGIALKPQNPTRAHHRESYISIDILATHRGKGYGSEAINWVLQWGFQIAGLHRISIESFSYNDGACRLYERLGFVPEGRKRKAIWFNGDWHDYVLFGMLEDEWREKTGDKKF